MDDQTIREIYSSKESCTRLCEVYNVTKHQVYGIWAGKIGRSITEHRNAPQVHRNNKRDVSKPMQRSVNNGRISDVRPGTEPWKDLEIPVQDKLSMAIDEFFR